MHYRFTNGEFHEVGKKKRITNVLSHVSFQLTFFIRLIASSRQKNKSSSERAARDLKRK